MTTSLQSLKWWRLNSCPYQTLLILKPVSPLSLWRHTSNSFAQWVMLHSRELLCPFPCWKGAWVLGSLSVEICQKYSADLLGPEENNTPRPRGPRHFTLKLCGSETQRPGWHPNHNPYCLAPAMYTIHFYLLCSIFLPRNQPKGRLYEFTVLSMLSLPPHLLNHVTSHFFR